MVVVCDGTDVEEDHKTHGLTKSAPQLMTTRRIHVVAGPCHSHTEGHVLEEEEKEEDVRESSSYLRYDGYRDELVGVMVGKEEWEGGHVESVEQHRRGTVGSREPALRISEKVWTRAVLTCDADVGTSDVSWVESGVQASSYLDEVVVEVKEEQDVNVDATHGTTTTNNNNTKKTLVVSASEAMDRLGMMLFQNHDMGAFQDFLSWNDPVDDCQPTHGSLLPLWETVCDGESSRHVTCMCWHPGKDDIFAVGVGSLNHGDFSGGCVGIYSMFDMHLARVRVCTRAGVTCVAFSPDGQYLAMGLHDGGVAVWSCSDTYSTRTTSSSSTSTANSMIQKQKISPPLLRECDDVGMHHVFPVWGVAWESNEVVRSSGQDGMEGVWRVGDKALERTGSRIIGVQDSYHSYDPYVFLQNRVDRILNLVCCSAVGGTQQLLYGTLEGEILSCDGDDILKTSYHKAPVYSVSVNPFDGEYIMAASLDWSVSIWKSSDLDTVLLDVDVGEPVVDAQWSMTSSTTFAVATETGNVYVYDLAVSKEVPLCQQRVCGSASLTCVGFHKKHPVIFVGTSDGRVLCLKLSPNLRCRKEHDDGNDFAFLDDAHGYTERPVLGLEEQREVLHGALVHPF